MSGIVKLSSIAISCLLVGLAGASAQAFDPAGPEAPGEADCTGWTQEWDHPSLDLAFETRTCDWSSSDDRIFGRWRNYGNRSLTIEGRVWVAEPTNCTRGGVEVMFFYQTIPAGGYSNSDFTIQPKGTHFWVCAVERNN